MNMINEQDESAAIQEIESAFNLLHVALRCAATEMEAIREMRDVDEIDRALCHLAVRINFIVGRHSDFPAGEFWQAFKTFRENRHAYAMELYRRRMDG